MIKHFCQFPWTQLSVNIGSNQWRWCPMVPYQPNFVVEYPDSNKNLMDLKDSIEKDKRSDMCRKCWSEEDLGFRSYRQAYGGDIAYGVGLGLRYLIIDLEEHNDANALEKLKELLIASISSFKLIHIKAGKYTNESFDLIKTLVDSDAVVQKPELRIETDGNYIYDMANDLTSLRKKGWKTNVIFQLEAIGDNMDFLRGCAQWEIVRPNFKKMVLLQHCRQIEVKVTALNIHMLSDIPTWLDKVEMIDVVKPIVTIDQQTVGALGELGLYLAPGLSKWKEHPKWTDATNKVIKIIRKQRMVKPNQTMLVAIVDQAKMKEKESGIVMPMRIKKLLYLADLSRRQAIIGNAMPDDEGDPVVES